MRDEPVVVVGEVDHPPLKITLTLAEACRHVRQYPVSQLPYFSQ
jgi:hypothetical protein